MRIERMTERAKEYFLWIYVTVILAGMAYAACTGQEIKTPGEILYEKTHN